MVIKRCIMLLICAAVVVLAGCHDHQDVIGEWQRVNPDDFHVFEEEMIVFTESDVFYFGAFGGPNTMVHEKHDHHFNLYPAYKGTYTLDEDATPFQTLAFHWTHYWPDDHESAEFESFHQKAIWDIHVDAHGSHEHVYLYINFGDDHTRPEGWPGEIKFERINHGHHDHDHDHEHH